MNEQPEGTLSSSGERAIASSTFSGVAATGDNPFIVTYHIGSSYGEIRQIFLDLFRLNFDQLTGEAARIAQERAEAITEAFLEKLRTDFPDAIERFRQPGNQRALYRVQEAAACSEDESLNELLVDLLVSRVNEGSRTLKQLVLDEALRTVPKLSVAQINALSWIFYFRYTRSVALSYETALAQLAGQMSKYFADLQPLASSEMALRHLEYAGCVAISIGSIEAGKVLADTYFGIFSRGISPHAVTAEMRPAFLESRSESGLIYCPVSDGESLNAYLARLGLSEHMPAIKSTLVAAKLNPSEVLDKISGVNAGLGAAFSLWDDTLMKNANVTSVGTAIGHANLALKSDFATSLDVWISEQ